MNKNDFYPLDNYPIHLNKYLAKGLVNPVSSFSGGEASGEEEDPEEDE